jgi:hypothetical protein
VHVNNKLTVTFIAMTMEEEEKTREGNGKDAEMPATTFVTSVSPPIE